MGNWTFAWDGPEGDASEIVAARQGATVGKWAFLMAGLAFAFWLFVYGTGIFTTLGWAEGSERHDRFGIRSTEDSAIGLGTMYLLEGQTAWWDYDVTVEGSGGVRLIIANAVPHRDGMLIEDVQQTERGRLELVAPRAGLYSFRHEQLPIGGAFGRSVPGRTRYAMRWGAD